MNKKTRSNTQSIFFIIGIVVIIMLHITVFMLGRANINSPVFKFFFSFKDAFISSIIAVMAAIFGPFVGLIMGFIDRFIQLFYIVRYHDPVRYYINQFFHGSVLVYLFYGVFIGAFWKYFNISKKKLTIKIMLLFNIVQIVSNILFRYILIDIFLMVKTNLIIFIRDMIIICLFSTVILYLYSKYFYKMKNNADNVMNMQK